VCYSRISIFPVVQFAIWLLFSAYSCYYGFDQLFQLKNKMRNNRSSPQELHSFRTQLVAFLPVVILILSSIINNLFLLVVFIVSFQSDQQFVKLFPILIPIGIMVYSAFFGLCHYFSHSNEFHLIICK